MGTKTEESKVKTFGLRVLTAINSRKVRLIRWLIQIASFLLVNGGLIGVNWSLGILPINQPVGAPFTTVLGAFDVFQAIFSGGLFPFLVFGVTLIIGGLFGRMLCGWVCPFGFFQDLLRLIPVKKLKISKPLNKGLRDIRAVIFWGVILVGSFVGYKELINQSVAENFGVFAQQPWTPFNPAATLFVMFFYMIFWKQYPGGSEDFAAGDWSFMFYFRIVILLVVIGFSIFIPRFYCRYVCPIGYAMGFTAKYSLIGIARNPARCTRCGECEAMCERTAMQVPILDYSYQRVRDANCTNCGNCLDACPHGAIYFKFKG
ncbi:MAG: 4Fe-4S binding protein [Candidatus Heimdallarchaeota archaeon]|nr:4Fe-4S binding protein [Candidatus Heimdallarchaeota archaeon]